ncbi:polysaccharide deacetylase family protein [Plantactinospora sp. CA-290183]|uniref:polysaccharide deacetylase family protein n=1 Tax=Plantactinospora sp. CA-290183 TaxID=3240006 RepID=UPI003D8DB32F
MSRTRMLIAAVLVVGAVLGSAYALGRLLGTADDRQRPTAAGSPSAPPTSRPALPSPTATARPGDPEVPGTPRRLGPERGGPYGARITTGSAQLALTFDDGPDPRYTPQTLALLRRYGVKATFCLVGVNVRAHPELVRAIAADGHALCNHSWAHDVGLGSRSGATILTDLARTNQAIRAAVPGASIAYFRQPGGAWTPSVVTAARKLNMTSLHWTVDPRDWTRPGAGRITGTVTSSVFPGAIVLLHDAGGDRQGTVNALRAVLPNLTRRFRLAALPTDVPRAQPSSAQPAQAPGGPLAGPSDDTPAHPPAHS